MLAFASPLRGGLLRAVVVVILCALLPLPALACDLCAIYTATQLRESRMGLHLGIAEQFTSFNTLQRNGEEVHNPAGERMNSSITQILAAYNVSPRLRLQLNVPIIARVYRRQTANGISEGDESGIGDVSLVGSYTPFSEVTEHSVVRLTLLGGLKLPSGNSRRLKEELVPHDDGGHDDIPGPFRPLHSGGNTGGVVTGIHGHDLALGSGSVDGIIGAQLFASWDRLFFSGAVQYLLRTEGDFHYTYADDLMWNGGPGAFVWLHHDFTLGLQAVLSGESKGNDSLNDVTMDDTAITALFVGPGLAFTWGTSLGADLAADIPVIQNNSALQLVPDYRIRGGVTWHF